jgi:HEPN domain-containing protein
MGGYAPRDFLGKPFVKVYRLAHRELIDRGLRGGPGHPSLRPTNREEEPGSHRRARDLTGGFISVPASPTGMRPESRRWLEGAEADLRHAELSLQNRDHGWASFAAQQAAEKALKSWIIERSGELVHSHDLFRLAERAGLPSSLAEKCRDLYPAYFGTRYQDAVPYPSAARAPGDITTAQEVIQWVRSRLT